MIGTAIALLTLADPAVVLRITVQGGKTGAGYDAVTLFKDGSYALTKTATHESPVERLNGRTAEIAALMKRAELLRSMRDDTENDRQQSHWNTYVVDYEGRRIVVEGGSTERDPALRAFFELVDAVKAAVRQPKPFLRWLQ